MKKIIIPLVIILLLVVIGLSVYFLVFSKKSPGKHPVGDPIFSISGCRAEQNMNLNTNWYIDNIGVNYISEDGKFIMRPTNSPRRGYNICSTDKNSNTYVCTPQKRIGFVPSDSGMPDKGKTVVQWEGYGPNGNTCGTVSYLHQ